MSVQEERMRKWVDVLNDTDAEMSKIAADKLAEIGHPGAANDLVKAMQTRSTYVAAASAKALGRIQASVAIAALIKTAQEHQDVEVKSAAVESLGEMKAKEAVPMLAKIVDDYLQESRSDRFTRVRGYNRGLFMEAIRALKAIGTPEALRAARKGEKF